MKVNRQLLHWARFIHVYLSVILLVLLVFFAITGITLNHAGWVAKPEYQEYQLALARHADKAFSHSPKEEIIRLVEELLPLDLTHAEIEQEQFLWFIDLQLPGESFQLTLDTQKHILNVENTRYGLIAKFNDLHKARHANNLWKNIIDISGVLIILFSITGLLLLLVNKRKLAASIWVGMFSSVLLIVSAMH